MRITTGQAEIGLLCQVITDIIRDEAHARARIKDDEVNAEGRRETSARYAEWWGGVRRDLVDVLAGAETSEVEISVPREAVREITERLGSWRDRMVTRDRGSIGHAVPHSWVLRLSVELSREVGADKDRETRALGPVTRPFTRLEFAAAAGIRASTLSAMVSRGQAPAPTSRVGSTPLWDRDVVMQWLASRPGQGARTDLRGEDA